MRVRFVHSEHLRCCRARDAGGVVLDNNWVPVGVSPPIRTGLYRLGPDDYIVADDGQDPNYPYVSTEPSSTLAARVAEKWNPTDQSICPEYLWDQK